MATGFGTCTQTGSVNACEDRRDVVLAAAIECGEQQVVDAFLRGQIITAHDAGNGRVTDFFRQAIAAQ